MDDICDCMKLLLHMSSIKKSFHYSCPNLGNNHVDQATIVDVSSIDDTNDDNVNDVETRHRGDTEDDNVNEYDIEDDTEVDRIEDGLTSNAKD